MSFSDPLSVADFVALVLCIFLVVNAVYFCTSSSPDRSLIVWCILSRAAATVVISWYFVTFWWGADSTSYHFVGVDYASQIGADFGRFYDLYLSPAFSMETGNSTTRIQALSGLLHWVAMDSYLSVSFILALLSLCGQYLLYLVFREEYPDPRLRKWWIVGLLFLPSLVFWSSGLLKDPLGIFGLGCATWGIHRCLRSVDVVGLAAIGFGFYAMVLFRLEVATVLLVASVPWVLQPKRDGAEENDAAPLVRIALVIFIIMLASYTQRVDKRYDVEKLPGALAAQRATIQQVDLQSGAGSGDTEQIEGASWGTLVRAWPQATFFTLYRPMIWEGFRSPVLFPAAIENLVLLLMTIRMLIRFLTRPRLIGQTIRAPLFLTSFVFVAVFSLGLGVSSPNLGNVSRYRLPALPFFVAVLLIAEERFLTDEDERLVEAEENSLSSRVLTQRR